MATFVALLYHSDDAAVLAGANFGPRHILQAIHAHVVDPSVACAGARLLRALVANTWVLDSIASTHARTEALREGQLHRVRTIAGGRAGSGGNARADQDPKHAEAAVHDVWNITGKPGLLSTALECMRWHSRDADVQIQVGGWVGEWVQ